jgi:hypothetical protein
VSRPARVLSLTTLSLVLPLLPPGLAAQDTTAVRAAPADSLPLPPRTLAIKEPETPPGPLPPGSRYVFPRDSILWSGAATLSDLLGTVPGVYLARTGFVGLPEYAIYAGRGAAAIELYWDGLRLEPLGTDTLFVDPARLPLALVRRVEVEVLPTTLRVYLVSERHERLRPRSLIRVGSGVFSTAVFSGMFQHRWRSGVELVAAADFLGTDGASGPNRGDQSFEVFAKVGWLPTPRAGAEYQIRRQDHERDPVTAEGGGPGVPARLGTRTDLLFSLFAGTRADGLGLRAEGGLAVSAWDPDSGTTVPEQHIRRAYVGARFRTPTLTIEARGSLADARTLRGLEGRLGWAPLPGVVLSGDGRWERHEGGRDSRRVHGALALYYGPVWVAGEASLAEAVQAPALLADTALETTDLAARLGIRTGFLSGQAGVVQRDGYAPLAIPDLLPIAVLAPAGQTTYLEANLQLRPIRPLTVSAWWSDPVRGVAPDLQPPRHARGAITFRSKFWRTFRSGAFDLKLEAALETWSAGTAGLDGAGFPIALPPATFSELLIEFQIVGFTGFWNMRNAGNQAARYVPGLPYPQLAAQRFGVTWEFAN